MCTVPHKYVRTKRSRQKKKEKKKIDVSSNMSKRRVIRGGSDMNIAAELNIGGLQALRNGGMKKSWELGII